MDLFNGGVASEHDWSGPSSPFQARISESIT